MEQTTTTTNAIPSIKNRESLNALSESLKPKDVKFLLALKSTSSLEECIDNANGMIGRLEEFIHNGNSTEGLSFDYKSVTSF